MLSLLIWACPLSRLCNKRHFGYWAGLSVPIFCFVPHKRISSSIPHAALISEFAPSLYIGMFSIRHSFIPSFAHSPIRSFLIYRYVFNSLIRPFAHYIYKGMLFNNEIRSFFHRFIRFWVFREVFGFPEATFGGLLCHEKGLFCFFCWFCLGCFG